MDELRLKELREQYAAAYKAGDTKLMEKIVRIANAVKLGVLCYMCREAVALEDGYFCSMECKDKYYPPNKRNLSTEEMKKRILEMAKNAHTKTTT